MDFGCSRQALVLMFLCPGCKEVLSSLAWSLMLLAQALLLCVAHAGNMALEGLLRRLALHTMGVFRIC